MFCPKCGAQMEDNAPFCRYCGQSLTQQPTYQQPVQQPTYQQPVYQQPVYQQPVQQPTYQQPTYQQPAYQQPGAPLNHAPDMPMKWFKFVIYVQLFLAALVNLGSAVQALTGSQYNGEADLVYAFFPALKTADTLYGILCIAAAVFAIVTRFQLSGYRANGPKFYIGLLVANIVIPIIYGVMASSAMSGFDTSSIWSSTAGSMVGSVILLVCNIIYFNKRKHLFVN